MSIFDDIKARAEIHFAVPVAEEPRRSYYARWPRAHVAYCVKRAASELSVKPPPLRLTVAIILAILRENGLPEFPPGDPRNRTLELDFG